MSAEPVDQDSLTSLYPKRSDIVYDELDALLVQCAGGVLLAAQSFKRNLEAVFWTLYNPYCLAWTWVRNETFRLQYQSAETRVRLELLADAMEKGSDVSEMYSAMDWSALHSQTEREIDNRREEIKQEAVRRLREQDKSEQFAAGARELLRQGSVLLWGALESLAGDLFECILNTRPNLSCTLVKNSDAKKFIQMRPIDMDLLRSFDFDLSSSMGRFLAQTSRVDSVPAIKAVFAAVSLNPASLLADLGHPDLWQLSQRRNLILHRRAIVDEAYIKATSDSLTLGMELVLKPSDVRRYHHVVLVAGTCLIAHSNQLVATPDV